VRRAQIQSTETSTSKQVAERAVGSGSAGSFRQAAEVKGTVECADPVGRAVYVLGEATDDGGALRIRKPADKGLSFLVSLKSEEQLLQSTGRVAVGLLAGAAVAAAAGAAGVVYGIIRLVARQAAARGARLTRIAPPP
jgi:hypothetical protein